MHPHPRGNGPGTPVHLTCTAIIPARYHASRLPGKALADICGRPMIEHVYRRAAKAPSIGQVLVATDDRRIADAVEAFGGTASMTRADHASGTDRLAEVASHLDCDIVVNVQGDEPLLDPRMIEEAIEPFRQDASLQMGTLRRRIEDWRDVEDPNVVKVVVDRNDFALYFSRWPIPYLRAEYARVRESEGPRVRESIDRLPDFRTFGLPDFRPDPVYKHIGLYVYRRNFLLEFARLEPTPLERAESLEQLRALEHGVRIKAVETVHESIGVDTPEDLERVRRAFQGPHSTFRRKAE